MSETPLVTKMWSKDGFSISLEKGITRTADITEGYQITAPVDYTKKQIAALPGLPITGDKHPDFNDMRVTKKDVVRNGPCYWVGMITYTGTNEDPTEERPVFRWGKSSSNEPVDEDRNGKPIVTANDEKIDGISKNISDLVLNVQRAYRFFNPAITHQYLDSVSNDTFAGFPAGTARLTGYSADLVFDDTKGGFWRVSAEITFRYPYRTTAQRAWWQRVRHEGYYIRDNGFIIKATDDNQEEVTRPVLLNRDGTRRTNSDEADWLEWEVYTPLPYANLGLLN